MVLKSKGLNNPEGSSRCLCLTGLIWIQIVCKGHKSRSRINFWLDIVWVNDLLILCKGVGGGGGSVVVIEGLTSTL